MLLDHILNRLYNQLSGWLERAPQDYDFHDYMISQELVLLSVCFI